MKKLFTLMVAAATVFAGCEKEENKDKTNQDEATLSVNEAPISAVATAGTYAIAVTSNTTWTAAVNTEATPWCSLSSPASATGNGTVIVDVIANLVATARAATVTFTAGTLSKAVTVTQAAIPPPVPTYAASTQTWTFGSSPLVWSDAIRIPDCNKSSFTNSDTDPHCRSYTEGTNTWYYYNWAYVNTNAAALCPAPWHVPTSDESAALVTVTYFGDLIAAWGYGGYVNGSNMDSVGSRGYYWSSTEDSSGTIYAFYFIYTGTSSTMYIAHKYSGYQVRCVK